jgi:DNA-binding beta-propeller fold protein YncE
MRPVYRSLSLALMGLGAVACAAGSEPVDLGAQEQAVRGGRPPLTRVPQPERPFTAFETLQTRPLAMSPNGRLLFATNTPDNRLEVFKIVGDKLRPVASVAVGLEPIAVAARTDSEVWVVNHLSDSVSVVKVSRGDDDDDDRGHGRGGDDDHDDDEGYSAHVTRTLHVGDEPRDIVFAGADNDRAFITTAHRGQNTGDDPDLFDKPPGQEVGRADVWVFDANDLGTAMGGTRLTKLVLFADTPRALAASPDGKRVYAAPFFSGNQTTIASADAVRHAYPKCDAEGGPHEQCIHEDHPNIFVINGVEHPLTSRVVKFRDGHWLDDSNHVYDAWVRLTLPDYDVFTIDAEAAVPALIEDKVFAHAGTTLFNMAVNPANGKVYVANTEAHNDVRFEGPNELPVTTVRARAVDSRISVLDPSTGSFVHNNLNPHVVNGVGQKALSRTFPQDMVFDSRGTTLLVALQGSQKLGIYATEDLEAGRSAPSVHNEIQLDHGGPTGVVLGKNGRLAYVHTRFDNGISVVNVRQRFEIECSHVTMYNPEPASVTEGRKFLYDANETSENGTQACASCHVGGDFDGLSWDLGNPGGFRLDITRAASELVLWTAPPSLIMPEVPGSYLLFEAHDHLKGPMNTQSLRGLANHGSMHWRGDRNGAVKQDGTPFIDPETNAPVVSAQPDKGIFDEFEAFKSFNVAFPGLLGRRAELSQADIEAFTRFALELTYPPNPIRNLDNSLTPEQAIGRSFYFQTREDGSELPVDRLHNCNGCHTLDRNGNAGASEQPGFFGSSGQMSFENLPQAFKVAHLRNAYQKVGMFASAPDENRALTPTAVNYPRRAVRGFGFQPDGAVGSINHHLTGRGFIKSPVRIGGLDNLGGIPTFQFDSTGNVVGLDLTGFPIRQAIASFVLAYDSNLFPIVGQQVTLGQAASEDAAARLALLEVRAAEGDCDLVAKGQVCGASKSYVLVDGSYLGDRTRDEPRTSAELLAELEENDALTFTCVPPGSGYRIGIDRDSDGYADGDELDRRSDPADPHSVPRGR